MISQPVISTEISPIGSGMSVSDRRKGVAWALPFRIGSCGARVGKRGWGMVGPESRVCSQLVVKDLTRV